MSLRNIIMLSVLSFLLVVVAINGWHLARLTDNIDQKLGEASFQVSKDTVESMLSQRLSSSVLLVNSRLGTDSGEDNTGDTATVDGATENKSDELGDSNHSEPSNSAKQTNRIKQTHRRMVVRSEQLTLEQMVDLQLSDSGESRSIILERGGQRYFIPIPRTELEKTMERATDAIIISSVLIIVLSIVFFFWISDRITRPLKKVSSTSALIGEGEFGVTIDDAGRFTGSELKHLIGSINKMSAHLQSLEIQKNRLKDQQTTSEISEITRGLAHSIRNPLHTILLSLELRPNDDDSYSKLQENIKQQIHRIDQHIKSLMVITTHEALTPEPINVYELLQSIVQEQGSHQCQLMVVSSVQPLLSNRQQSEKKAAIEKLTPEAFDWQVEAVYSELHAVFATLINNALEAMEGHSTEQQGDSGRTNKSGRSDKSDRSEIAVTVYLSRTNKAEYQIAFVDQGRGVSKQQQANLFKPHNTNKTHGSGMGLYIAQRIISGRYAGTIQYQPNQPQGSVFMVTLSNRELNGSDKVNPDKSQQNKNHRNKSHRNISNGDNNKGDNYCREKNSNDQNSDDKNNNDQAKDSDHSKHSEQSE